MKNIIYNFVEKYGEKLEIDLSYFTNSSFWVVVRQIVSALTGLSISVLFARFISDDTLGKYQLILAILSVVSIASLPGLNTAIFRSSAQKCDGDYSKAFRLSLLASLVGIPALLALGAGYYILGYQEIGLSLMMVAGLFPILYAPNIWDSFLQGKGYFESAAKYGSFQALINAVVIGLVVWADRDNLILLVLGYVLSNALLNLIFYIRILRYVENNAESKDFSKYGVFLTKINFLSLVAENLDKLLVGVLLSPGALAAYYILTIIPFRLKDAIKPFFPILSPRLLFVEGGLWRGLGSKKILLFGAAVSWCVFLGAYTLLVVPISQFLFGSGYAEYYRVSVYYVVLLAVLPALLISIKYAQMKKYDRVIVVSDTVYAALRIFLGITLIYFFGLIGAVMAYNISVLFWTIFYFIGVWKADKIEMKGTY